MTDERCSLRVTRRLDAAVDEVWHALVDAEARARWLGDVGGELHEVENGRVVELAFADSIARIEVCAEGAKTLLVVEHRDIPAPRGMRAIAVWGRALDRLESSL